MIALQIENNKDFTAKLLLENVFDDFLLSQGIIATGTTVTIDGHLNMDFYDRDTLTDETGQIRGYATWAEMKKLAFDRIKGKRLPLSFRFVLLADQKEVNKLLSRQSGQTTVLQEQVVGLFLNIRYSDNRIVCSTGVSLHTFSLDRSLEHLWDNRILDFFKEHQIIYSI